jgi:hypothetical protein
MKRVLIYKSPDGIDVVSTGQLGEMLGIAVNSTYVKGLGAVKPAMETNCGVFWNIDHVPLIAQCMARELLLVSTDFYMGNLNLSEVA